MSPSDQESTPPAADRRAARSFARAPDTYDRGRPDYPPEAVAWLVEAPRQQVLELGAGTGKLTGAVARAGHKILATDPSAELLAVLRAHLPRAATAVGTAEAIPVITRSVDVVLAAQAFHWFDPQPALREAARVLRVGGTLGLVWNHRDERIPWVRRLGSIIGSVPADDADPTAAIDDSGLFETVDVRRFRFWQPLGRGALRDLVSSRSTMLTRGEDERQEVLAEVDRLYDDVVRGANHLLMPYITTAYRTTVLPWALSPDQIAGPQTGSPEDPPDDLDPDSLLIDFR